MFVIKGILESNPSVTVYYSPAYRSFRLYSNIEKAYKYISHFTGMTLRQWYAGMTLSGIVCWDALYKKLPENIAKAAFKIADAMIAEAEKHD